MENKQRIILIDADVISHFVTAGEADYINKIFPQHPIFLLNKVYAELQRWPSQAMLERISLLLSKKAIQIMEFPEDNEMILKEYRWIKQMLFKGDGESACLAVARFSKNILASSNLRDIKNYCGMHKIDYLTTMDFLCQALKTGLFDENKCNNFLQTLRKAGKKLPVISIKDYQCTPITFLG